MRRMAALEPFDPPARTLHCHVTRIHNDHGGAATLRQLCAQYPPSFVERSAELQHILGVLERVQLETRRAAQHLAAAELLFVARPDASGLARLARSHRAATLARMGQVSRDEQALAGLDEVPSDSEACFVEQPARAWIALERGAVREVAPLFALLLPKLDANRELHLWLLSTPPTRKKLCPGIAPAIVGERPLGLRAIARLAQTRLDTWQGR